ncbi:LRP2-binding protein-like [Pollicipes pollicipes]|uniref:LRP2-binding protein-like n=1 Tax=Pollicipes pollicipes TaxID=41117 RepID=UPI001884F9A3|nr:LRP2-binding protein-like [Pollicipes pollicipes]
MAAAEDAGAHCGAASSVHRFAVAAYSADPGAHCGAASSAHRWAPSPDSSSQDSGPHCGAADSAHRWEARDEEDAAVTDPGAHCGAANSSYRWEAWEEEDDDNAALEPGAHCGTANSSHRWEIAADVADPGAHCGAAHSALRWQGAEDATKEADAHCGAAQSAHRWAEAEGGASPASPQGETEQPGQAEKTAESASRASSASSASDISDLGWEQSPSSGLLPPSDVAAERCLKKRAEAGDRRAVFYLGQLYFDTGNFERAKEHFLPIAAQNIYAQYQLGVMLFEGLGFEQDLKKGFRLMLTVAHSVPKTPEHEETIHKAQYNVARAYFMGFGAPSSEDDGRRWLDRAAADGTRRGSVKAQTMLAMLFARRDTLDLEKSFHWHSEATGNGSLESQGALGVMYLYGLGVRRDLVAARLCLTQAARRGNIYATGQLALFYYRFRFYQHAVRFGTHLARFEAADVAELARQSECLPGYRLFVNGPWSCASYPDLGVEV